MDLNCDLGEGEAAAKTTRLMRDVTSANIACGGHAGNGDSMSRCVTLALRHRVRIGAHPGPASRADFGRGPSSITPAELELLLLQQIGALEAVVRVLGGALHHVKLHGALYHAVESNSKLAREYVRSVRRWWPHLKIYALAGGRVAAAGQKLGSEIWEEAFADRSYLDERHLVPRSEPGAILQPLSMAISQAERIIQGRSFMSVEGKPIQVRAQTVCVHSDTPFAVPLAAAIRRLMDI